MQLPQHWQFIGRAKPKLPPLQCLSDKSGGTCHK
jgi:hypothetical protein